MFRNSDTMWTRTVRDPGIIIAIARKTPGINLAQIERWGGVAVAGWGSAFKPSALSGYASPEGRWGPCKRAGIGHGARTPAAARGIRSEPPTRGDASRTRPPETGLSYGLRALRHSKINGGFAEYWILDRNVALQPEFLLWPCAPGDVGRVAVKRPAARHCESQRQEADREATSLREASRRGAQRAIAVRGSGDAISVRGRRGEKPNGL